jgi:GH24 family phage-related lysozyme (muramidase)
MNPRLLKDYQGCLFDFVVQEESLKLKVYACSQHIPTIGIGYALAEKSGGCFRPRSGLDGDLAKIGATLTKRDNYRLSKICDMLNDGSIKQAINGSNFRESFDLAITEEQAKRLFLLCVPRYDAVIRQKLGLKLYTELQNSKEMVALFSLTYNAPCLIGKNLVNALREGNRARIRYEILYNSNKNRDVILDGRRKREAKQIGRYDSDTPNPAELKAEEETQRAQSAQIAAYDHDMAAKIKCKSTKRARGPRTVASYHRKRPQPGTAPNQKEVRTRIDGAKAHPVYQGRSVLERIIDLFGGDDKVIHRDWNNHPAQHDDRHYHRRWS